MRRRAGGRSARRMASSAQFHGEDPAPPLALVAQPPRLRRRDPVDAAPTGQRVASRQRLSVMRGGRHGQTGTDGVACAEQRSQVGLVGNP